MNQSNDNNMKTQDKENSTIDGKEKDMYPDADDLTPLKNLEKEDLDSLESRIIREKQKHLAAKQTEQAQAQQTGMKAGSEFLAAVLGGGVVGFFADKFLGTSPLILFIMVTVGFAYGIYRSYSVMNDTDPKQKKKK